MDMIANEVTNAPAPGDPLIGSSRPGPALVVRGVTKAFGSVVANNELDLELHGGRVHGLLGENGAGKSTVIKILGGIHRPDAGELILDGVPASIDSPYEASRLGIEIVHQESILIPALTIAENIALRWRIRGRLGGGLLSKFSHAAQDLGFRLDPQERVAALSIGARQRADIVIAMMGEPRVLILDEPTPIMAPDERTAFFTLVHRLADGGAAVILVTHRLREAVDECDDITVLRHGRNVASWTSHDFPTEAQMLDAMIGGGGFTPLPATPRRPLVRSGTLAIDCSDVSLVASERLTVQVKQFDVWPGEIVGVAGIEGSGQRELAGLLVGQLTPETGELRLRGRLASGYSAQELCAMVGDVPDEPTLGTVADLSIWQNLALPSLLWRAVGPRARRRLRSAAAESIERFNVKTPDGDAHVGTLSGGNKRRVVLARETHVKSPEILVLTYATRGLDARAADNLLRHIRDLALAGAAVVFISSDLDELLTLCDRISAIVDGRLTPPVAAVDLDHVQLAASVLGLSELSMSREHEPEGRGAY
jgi:simple sugar transport system ATP-binding protein